MNRRSFLGLLAGGAVAVAAAPVLAKLTPAVEPEQARQLLRKLQACTVRMYPLPIGTKIIRPGGVERFETFVQRDFWPDRLIVSGGGAGLQILNVSSSGEPQLDEAIDADFFRANAFGMRLNFQAVPAGDSIVMAAHNASAEPQLFQAMLLGRCPVTPEQEAREAELAADYDAAAELGDADDDDDEWTEDTDPDRTFEA